MDTRGIEPRSPDFQSGAYTKSAKCPFAEADRFELSESFVRLNPLAEGRFRPLTHTSFLIDDAKLGSRYAAYLRSEKITKNDRYAVWGRSGLYNSGLLQKVWIKKKVEQSDNEITILVMISGSVVFYNDNFFERIVNIAE